jgi:peptidase E
MNKQLLVYGSGRHRKPFLNYLAKITGKERPNICFLPTASGDDRDYIISFFEVCKELPVVPYVLKVWINSYDQKETFAEMISKMDAIVVGGGNTLNMLAIWKAQGIDTLLREAYDRGCVMAGGSAGSLCWFNAGTTDSRPKELSIVQGMAFLDKSHCPHYNSEPSRRPLYHQNILSGKLTDGYACDDTAAIHFINGEVQTAISLDTENHAYWVCKQGDDIVERTLDPLVLSE